MKLSLIAQSSVGRTLCLLLLVVMMSLMGYSVWKAIVPWGYPSGDAAWYLTTGRFLSEGYMPYRDIRDHKPPMIHIVNAAGFTICPSSPFGAQMIFLALFVAAMVAWWKIHLNLGVPRSVAPLLVVTTFGVLLSTNGQWFLMTETLAFIFTSFAVYYAVRSGSNVHGMLAGAFIALASLSKQQMVFDGVALAVLLGITSERVTLRRLAWAIFGGCIVYGVIILALSWAGCLREAWECFLFNFSYAGKRYSLLNKLAKIGNISFLVPTGLFVAGWFMSMKGYSTRGCGMVRWLLGRVGLLVWFLAVLSAGIWGQPHYAILMWTASLFSLGVGCRALRGTCPENEMWPFDLLRRALEAVRRRVSPGLIWTGVATVVLCTFLAGMRLYPRVYYVRPVVGKLNRMFDRDSSAYVFTGEGGRFWMALKMKPTTRWSCVDGLAERPFTYVWVIDDIMESLGRTPPDVVVFDKSMHPYYSTSEGFRMLETLLRAYVQERQFERLALLDPTCEVYVTKAHSALAHRRWNQLHKQLTEGENSPGAPGGAPGK